MMKNRLPLMIAAAGLLLATISALYPRWDRQWREDPRLTHEGNDTVRSFILSTPPPPDNLILFQGKRVYSYRADVRWGETLGIWALIAVPFCVVAGMMLARSSRENGQ